MQSILKVDISQLGWLPTNTPYHPQPRPMDIQGGEPFPPTNCQGKCPMNKVNVTCLLSTLIMGYCTYQESSRIWKIPAFWLGAVSDLGWHVSIVIMISRAEVPRSHERFGSKHILKCFIKSLVIYVFYSKMIKVVTLGLTVIWLN